MRFAGLVGGQPASFGDMASQGLLLQQAALALQMVQHMGSPVAHAGSGLEAADSAEAANSALAAALRQQGACECCQEFVPKTCCKTPSCLPPDTLLVLLQHCITTFKKSTRIAACENILLSCPCWLQIQHILRMRGLSCLLHISTHASLNQCTVSMQA